MQIKSANIYYIGTLVWFMHKSSLSGIGLTNFTVFITDLIGSGSNQGMGA